MSDIPTRSHAQRVSEAAIITTSIQVDILRAFELRDQEIDALRLRVEQEAAEVRQLTEERDRWREYCEGARASVVTLTRERDDARAALAAADARLRDMGSREEDMEAEIERLAAVEAGVEGRVKAARLDGARAMHDKVREVLADRFQTIAEVNDLDPAAVVGSAPIASPALGCAACPNFVAEGGNAGGWRCRAVDDSIVVGLWIDGATGTTNGYMPDGSAGEVPTDARTCPAFGKPAVVGSGS